MNRLLNIMLGGLLAALVFGCGGAQLPPGSGQAPPPGSAGTGPAGIDFPADTVRPGEQLNSLGYVEPGPRGRKASDTTGEYFVAGNERFSAGGLVADNGEATSLAAYDGALSYAVYRLVLGGAEPGWVEIDANAPLGGAYYIGLADFAGGSWSWHGPFAANHVRLGCIDVNSLRDYTSPLGNVFVCAVPAAGAFIDVVGVGAAAVDPADETAPATPDAPEVQPFNGALLVSWPAVEDADLAGYRVYWCSQWFFDGDGTGVQRSRRLISRPEFLHEGVNGNLYVRIQAVDNSGNESAVSAVALGTPLGGSAPELKVEVSFPSVAVNQPLQVVATGAASYAFDMDGDGEFEIADNSSGISSLDTAAAGIYRIAVRGFAEDGLGLAQGGASVLVVEGDPGNEPPSASLQLSQLIAYQETAVTLDCSGSFDADGSIVLYEYDFDGDRFYDFSSPDQSVIEHAYAGSGVFRARVRVTDNGGARDTASKLIRVNEAFDVPQQWPLRGGNPRRTGLSPFAGPQTNTKLWSFQAESFLRSSPAVAEDGTVYIGCDDDNLYAITPGGGLKWKYPLGGNVSSSPAIAPNGVIYVGSWDTRLYAITPSRVLVWTFETGEPIVSSPVVGPDGTVYVGSNDTNLYAIDPAGQELWRFPTGGRVVSSPALGADGTVYFGSKDMHLYAVAPDGSLKWQFTTASDVDASPAVGPDGTVYVGSWDRYLYALSPGGELLWSFRTGANIDASPAIAADGTVYVCSRNRKLYALKPDGSFKWEFITGDGIASSPAIGNDGIVYFGSADGLVYALNPDGSQKWTFATGADVDSSPALGLNGTLYVGSLDMQLYAIGP